MAVRISGLVSGLDTDAIVQELVSAYQTKVDALEDDKTLLEWKTEKWDTINTDVNSLFKGELATMRLTGSYAKQSVEVSDTTKASVTASGTAALGVQTLNVIKMAKAGYLTGGQISATSSSATLASLGYSSGETTVQFTVGGETHDITVDGSTTIASFLKSINQIGGVTANYDANNKRIYITSNQAGVENDFSLTSDSAAGNDALYKMGLCVKSQTISDYYDSWITEGTGGVADWETADDMAASISALLADTDASWAVFDGEGNLDETATKANLSAIADKITYLYNAIESYNSIISDHNDAKTEASAQKGVAEAYHSINEANEAIASFKSTTGISDEDYETLKGFIEAGSLSEEDQASYDALMTDLLNYMNENRAEDTDEYTTTDLEEMVTSLSDNFKTITAAQNTISSYEETYNGEDDLAASEIEAIVNGTGEVTYEAFLEARTAEITAAEDGIEAAETNIANANKALENYKTLIDGVAGSEEYAFAAGMTDEQKASAVEALYEKTANIADLATNTTYNTDGYRVDASDAQIKLNGVYYTSSNNSFSINGLTIVTKAETGDGDANALSVTTTTDSDGIYDMIKGFFSKYNTLINGLNTDYNAESARGYDPLSDDEKEAMSEEEVEKWENKIKSALLKNDSSLSSLISLFNNALSKSYYILDGKAATYSTSEKAYMYNGEVITDPNGKRVTSEAGLKSWAARTGATSYSLSSFGVKTLGYLNAADNEEYAYHIDGDEDDGETSGNTDKLRTAITTDPDTVSAFFSALSSGLYSSLNTRMTSSDLNSKYKVYNDKEITKEKTEINSRISDWEDRLEELEDYWYSKFSAMESALAELQSQQSALSGLLGSSS